MHSQSQRPASSPSNLCRSSLCSTHNACLERPIYTYYSRQCTRQRCTCVSHCLWCLYYFLWCVHVCLRYSMYLPCKGRSLPAMQTWGPRADPVLPQISQQYLQSNMHHPFQSSAWLDGMLHGHAARPGSDLRFFPSQKEGNVHSGFLTSLWVHSSISYANRKGRPHK